jgi:hypothetical protein
VRTSRLAYPDRNAEMNRLLYSMLILVALAAVTIGPATASAGQLRTGYHDGTDSASRSARKCKISATDTGTLVVTCGAGGVATIVYDFATAARPRGSVSASVDAMVGRSAMSRKVSVPSSQKVRVTLTIKGKARVEIRSASVSYYT